MPTNSLQPITANLTPQESVYKPSEIIGIFNSALAKQSVNAQVVYLRGIYLASGKQSYGGYFYDSLRDEDRQEELTIVVNQQQRENLKNGNLVHVGGVLARNVNAKGYIQLILNVSRIEVVQEQAIDEAEIKRMELRQKKADVGFKNVDGILEQKLFVGNRPSVALVFAQSSITMSDFNAGIKAAQASIDFKEYRVNFASPVDFCNTLTQIDAGGYDVIALVRGGGSGIEHLDDLKVLECVAGLGTAVIAAIGHVEEKLFIKQIADKVSPIPNGLGSYFADIVEKVNEQKNQSRAVLTEQIRKQFQEQIETSKKQNKELQEKFEKLTKSGEEAQKLHRTQIESANKQNKDLQDKLDKLTKTMETTQKTHAEQMAGLQKQLKDQSEAAEKARKEQQAADASKTKQFNESLAKMQDTNTKLQASLDKATTGQTEAQKQIASLQQQLTLAQAEKPSSNKGVVIVLVLIIIVMLVFLIMK